MCNSGFTNLHAHSFYSVQDALPSPEQLILGAKKLGQTAIAITDHGKEAGWFEFAEAGYRHGIKPILGNEMYFAKDRFNKDFMVDGKKSREKLAHLTILAQNKIGHKNLLQLGYEASKPECSHYSPRIDFDYLTKHSEGLIILSGCLGSELNQALLKSTYEDGLAIAKKYKELLGDQYFIELQYHGIEEQKHNLPLLVKIAKDLNIKMVASNDVHYVNPEDWKLHDVLIQMRDLRDDKTGKNNGKRDAYGSHQFFLKSYDQMFKIFGDKFPESISNTKLIEEMVEDFYEIDTPHLLPEAEFDLENKDFKRFWSNKLPAYESKEAYLAFKAFTGLKDFGLDTNPEYVKRLKYECETIWNMGVTDYFLIQKEMVDFMKEKNILYGVRGSGVGSLLNYCLGISYADPIKFNLMFERFLNPGRGNQYKIDLEGYSCENLPNEVESLNWVKIKCKEFLSTPGNSHLIPRISKEIWILENQKIVQLLKSAHDDGFKLKNNLSNFVVFYALGLTDTLPTKDLIVKKVSGLPDIDTDIDDSRRQEVIDWAKNRFGAENVKSVGTWGTYKAKAAILGTLKTSDKFKKLYADNLAQMALKVSGTIPGKPGTTIESAIKDSSDFAYWTKKFPEETQNASKLNGVISNLGIHAGAIVISEKPIHEVVPIENSKGNLCTAFDMTNVERMGLVKYDYLGLKTYQQITLALNFIKKRHNVEIDLLKITFDDPKIYKEVFTKGNTVSIFQFNGPGMQKTLKEVKASDIEDLIAVVSLFRPGPMDYISEYAKGKHNPSSICYSHPTIEKHLSTTYGIMVYQEQAMFLARELANLDWAEVDKLRKGIAKKEGKQFDEACENFARKALMRGTPNNIVDEVIKIMSKFGGYAFNRSHATGYAVLAYWTAYLKTYYPSDWMAACMETDKDDTDKLNLYQLECERLGIKVENPSVNQSDIIINVSDNGTIYMPITSLKGVGNSGASVSQNRPYQNLTDFLEKSDCNKSIFVALASGGALNCLVEDQEVDEEYFLDYWLDFSKKKAETKKNSNKKSVNNNSLSFLDNSKKPFEKEMLSNSLLELLEDF
jgi:DNA polymerase III alpha subunit